MELMEDIDQVKVIAPKAGKGGRNLALLEEIKQREVMKTKSRVTRTLNLKVDKACDVKNVSLFEDYTCQLQQDDISFNDNQQTRYLVMQLLERNDGKKWMLWIKSGKLAKAEHTTTINEYFNKHDAILEFESLFLKRTSNKWSDRSYF